jgi:hypothetical protein
MFLSGCLLASVIEDLQVKLRSKRAAACERIPAHSGDRENLDAVALLDRDSVVGLGDRDSLTGD